MKSSSISCIKSDGRVSFERVFRFVEARKLTGNRQEFPHEILPSTPPLETCWIPVTFGHGHGVDLGRRKDWLDGMDYDTLSWTFNNSMLYALNSQ